MIEIQYSLLSLPMIQRYQFMIKRYSTWTRQSSDKNKRTGHYCHRFLRLRTISFRFPTTRHRRKTSSWICLINRNARSESTFTSPRLDQSIAFSLPKTITAGRRPFLCGGARGRSKAASWPPLSSSWSSLSSETSLSFRDSGTLNHRHATLMFIGGSFKAFATRQGQAAYPPLDERPLIHCN